MANENLPASGIGRRTPAWSGAAAGRARWPEELLRIKQAGRGVRGGDDGLLQRTGLVDHRFWGRLGYDFHLIVQAPAGPKITLHEIGEQRGANEDGVHIQDEP